MPKGMVFEVTRKEYSKFFLKDIQENPSSKVKHRVERFFIYLKTEKPKLLEPVFGSVFQWDIQERKINKVGRIKTKIHHSNGSNYLKDLPKKLEKLRTCVSILESMSVLDVDSDMSMEAYEKFQKAKADVDLDMKLVYSLISRSDTINKKYERILDSVTIPQE